MDETISVLTWPSATLPSSETEADQPGALQRLRVIQLGLGHADRVHDHEMLEEGTGLRGTHEEDARPQPA